MPIPTSRSFGTKQLMNGLSVIPNSSTAVSDTDSIIFQIVVCNDTAGAVTLSVLDRQNTPLKLLDAKSIGANDTVIFSFPEGVFMDNGITWQAGAAASLHGEIFGFEAN